MKYKILKTLVYDFLMFFFFVVVPIEAAGLQPSRRIQACWKCFWT